jgi:hypothetical protein
MDNQNAITEIADLSQYTTTAETDLLIMTDIVDSTSAVAQGRYKEITIAVTKAIAALRNACSHHETQVQHGGDGFIAKSHVSNLFKISGVLWEMKESINRKYGFGLYASIWTKKELDGLGIKVYHRHFLQSNGSRQWQIHCSEMHKLENRLKSGFESAFRFVGGLTTNADGFRCDFTPVKHKRAQFACCIISLVEQDVTDRMITTREILKIIQQHSTHGLSSPIKKTDLHWLTNRQMLEDLSVESNYYKLRLFVNWWFIFMNKLKCNRILPLNSLPFISKKVADSVDHIKYDGNLKFVISVNNDDRTKFEGHLNALAKESRIKLGIHWSKAAIITCSVNGPHENLHFIDGLDGGLTLAAANLKTKLKQSSKTEHGDNSFSENLKET